MNVVAPQANTTAEAAVRALLERDAASRALGITLETIRPGFTRLSMMVRPDMANGHGICHGGLIFALADTACAFASNSHNANAVTPSAQINFVAPAKIGEMLVAEAVELSSTRRTGIYDVTVRRGDGDVVALFRGNSYRIKGEVVDDLKKTP